MRVENHAVGRPPHRFLDELAEQLIGRVRHLKVGNILDVGRGGLDRNPDGAQFFGDDRIGNGHSFAGIGRADYLARIRRFGA